MRTEKEMYDLLIDVAGHDERIRAAYLSGSRTNPNIKKDIFQDYDIVYIVTETDSFLKQEDWIDVFGKRLYMQLPDAMDKTMGHSYDFENCYGYLIQLADGNRIDLHIQTLNRCLEDIESESLYRVLVDKDHILPLFQISSDESHWVRRPTAALYSCCCNEFWWLHNNVAKGLWREEIPYVMDMLHICIRPQLVTMLSWYVGIQADFSCSVGKCGKFLKSYLSDDFWVRYLKTYSIADIPAIWDSVFVMCGLFEEAALSVARELSFQYNQEEANNSLFFLKNAKRLVKDATEVL